MSDERNVLTGISPEEYDNRTVAVAMSGGVDSSLTAILLKEAGFDVVGLTMRLWDYDRYGGRKSDRGCCDLSFFEDARKVAYSAGIPHYTLDMRDEFERLVVSDFIDEYLTGRTPNPCVRCNTFIKWETLQKKASAFGCSLIATGHYARITRFGDGTHALMKGVDASKDQSYFLWGLGTDKLARTLFPLGAMTKDETRREAAKRGLVNARRRESQEICFIPDNDHGRFLRERFTDNPPLQLQSGDVLTMDGAVAGQHSGSACYTIGQRKGLGVALGRPVYVTAVDTKANSITVGGDSDLLSEAMTVGGIVWSRGKPPLDRFACTVRIRYRHAGVTSQVTTKSESEASVVFGEPQRAVTPGQSAVFYDGDMVLGGGIILSAE